jgi:phage tail-like protein
LVFKTAPPQNEIYRLAGAASGYRGPVAALQAASGPVGALWLHPGEGHALVRFDPGAAHAHRGAAWGGPFGAGLRSVLWQQVSARLIGLGEGRHVRFFAHGGLDPAASPPPPDLDAPFEDPEWQPLPLDITDGLVPAAGENGAADLNTLPRAPYIWIGVFLTGEGAGSPVLSQVRLTYDRPTYRQRLPAIFSRDPAQAALLDRLLALFESFNEEAEKTIRGLDRLFDPQAAPDAWLSWLAGWVGLDLDENWPESFQRQLIGQALALSARRGTPQGLQTALRLFAGAESVIEEPILEADWWSLEAAEGERCLDQAVSGLGFTTRLAPGGAEGAVLGISADLDRSSLDGAEESGAALFRDVAHQFTVSIYRGKAASEQDLERVRAVIEREKPAHTIYALCTIEPQMRVGFQARLGIDTVVAGPTPPTPLDGPAGSASPFILGGDPSGQVGSISEIGRSTRLG